VPGPSINGGDFWGPNGTSTDDIEAGEGLWREDGEGGLSAGLPRQILHTRQRFEVLYEFSSSQLYGVVSKDVDKSRVEGQKLASRTRSDRDGQLFRLGRRHEFPECSLCIGLVQRRNRYWDLLDWGSGYSSTESDKRVPARAPRGIRASRKQCLWDHDGEYVSME
jgi:hypothetical protein